MPIKYYSRSVSDHLWILIIISLAQKLAVSLVLVPQMGICFVGLPFCPSASWPLSLLYLLLFFLFLLYLTWFMRECLKDERKYQSWIKSIKIHAFAQQICVYPSPIYNYCCNNTYYILGRPFKRVQISVDLLNLLLWVVFGGWICLNESIVVYINFTPSFT